MYQWHTFYGSPDGNYSVSVAVDGSGNVYVTGYSEASWTGPEDEAPLHAYTGDDEVFVLKAAE